MNKSHTPPLFPAPELPPETLVALADLPENLGPIEPDAGFVRNVEAVGVYHPICLKKENNGYRVVDGRRRIKAARKANQKHIPARIFPSDWPDQEIIQLSLHENRKPNPISELEAFEASLNNGETTETLKQKLGLKQSQIRVFLKLQNLIVELRAALSNGQLKPSVAYLAAKLPKSQQRKLLKVLKEENQIKVKDIKEINTARKKDAVHDLPMSLFEDEGDWKIGALAKAQELRPMLEPRGNNKLLVLLGNLEEEIKKS